MNYCKNLVASCAISVLAIAAAPALAETYDFSTVLGASTPTSIGVATFSSPNDPGAYSFGPNAGLFTDLGANVLSGAGDYSELDITFATAQKNVSFNFALGDFLGTNDVLTVTPVGGTAATATAVSVGDLFPEGSFSLTNASPFTELKITDAGQYSIVVSDLTSSVPEPATWAMMILGFGAVALRMSMRSVRAA